ncbi:MAG: GDYXXLXY domain-containing protein [Candidatus Obscuribacterales bacterium]|nr:GDYXXLXY domain-containing protein [Candidatus Obscuribacterales bacterium]
MISRKTLFASACAFQTCAVLFLALPPALTLSSGKTVTVLTEPVDPQDMFRGDYIRLGYKFSRVPSQEKFEYNSKVFVRLKQDADKQWKPIGASKTRPAAAQDEVVLLGQYEWADEKNTIQVRYGIEQVFVPEGRGKNISSADKIEIELAVPESGRAVIKRAQLGNDLLYQWRWI